MSTPRKVAVAMSGGVDSSVAAALLVEAGEDAFGLMMRLWSDGPDGANRCCSPDDIAAAKRVAAQLEIPFYVLDVRDHFKVSVVDFFVDGYVRGVTPNPCLECNRHIRWGFLLDRALAMGATHLSTGHYARATRDGDGWRLERAKDRNKDQSYVLSVMGQTELSHALFPLGDYTKPEVRELAARFALPVAERRESQDLCFVGHSDYRDLLKRESGALPPPGEIVNSDGEVIGTHSGLADYTIGQRKGLGIAASQPLYVLEKDLSTHRLVVGPRERLGRTNFLVERLNWVSGHPPKAPFEAQVRVRYRGREVPASVVPLGLNKAEVRLVGGLPDVTPGQAAVFYRGEECLGGGVIQA